MVLARIPVEATVASIHHILKPHGVNLGSGKVINAATYVGNFYVVAPSTASAVVLS